MRALFCKHKSDILWLLRNSKKKKRVVKVKGRWVVGDALQYSTLSNARTHKHKTLTHKQPEKKKCRKTFSSLDDIQDLQVTLTTTQNN